MTDGTTASIAQKEVKVRSYNDKADLAWLSLALTRFMGGDVSSFSLPPTVAGMLPTVLWWCSPDLMAIVIFSLL